MNWNEYAVEVSGAGSDEKDYIIALESWKVLAVLSMLNERAVVGTAIAVQAIIRVGAWSNVFAELRASDELASVFCGNVDKLLLSKAIDCEKDIERQSALKLQICWYDY